MSFELQLADDVDWAGAIGLEQVATRMVGEAAGAEQLPQPLEVCLRLTNDAEIRDLNQTYRGIEDATDVLAFALREAPGGEVAPHLLGDVVISVEAAERQRGPRTLVEEVELLFAHGLCHLLGYDHQNDLEEAEMNARVSELLAASGSRVRVDG